MSDDPEKAREDARKRFMGRAVVVGFIVLVAAYVLATFVR